MLCDHRLYCFVVVGWEPFHMLNIFWSCFRFFTHWHFVVYFIKSHVLPKPFWASGSSGSRLSEKKSEAKSNYRNRLSSSARWFSSSYFSLALSPITVSSSESFNTDSSYWYRMLLMDSCRWKNIELLLHRSVKWIIKRNCGESGLCLVHFPLFPLIWSVVAFSVWITQCHTGALFHELGQQKRDWQSY